MRLADACGGVIRRPGCFDGWIAERLHLVGPTGERYTLEELRAAHWLRQLHEVAAGTPDRCTPQGLRDHSPYRESPRSTAAHE